MTTFAMRIKEGFATNPEDEGKIVSFVTSSYVNLTNKVDETTDPFSYEYASVEMNGGRPTDVEYLEWFTLSIVDYYATMM